MSAGRREKDEIELEPLPKLGEDCSDPSALKPSATASDESSNLGSSNPVDFSLRWADRILPLAEKVFPLIKQVQSLLERRSRERQRNAAMRLAQLYCGFSLLALGARGALPQYFYLSDDVLIALLKGGMMAGFFAIVAKHLFAKDD